MNLQKKDFIEIEFTGKTKEGTVFDSNKKEDLKNIPEANPNQAKPFIFSLGENMFLDGVDNFLIGKPNSPADYTVELSPEKAFGKREPKLIKLMPLTVFRKHKLNPIPGIIFNFDGRMGKVLSVSGGRTQVDFNHPLAGKYVIYEVKFKRKIEDLNEKTKSLIEFFARQEIPFKIQDKKLILDSTNQITKFLELFKDKFKELLDLDLEIKEKPKD